MKEKLHEQLSALVDNELGEQEQALLFRQLAGDAALSQRLARYQMISDALQNHLPSKFRSGFHQRVQAAVSAEPSVRSRRPLLADYYKPVAGVALAASVAMVAVLSLQSARRDDADAVPAVASAVARDNYIRAAANDALQSNEAAGGVQSLEIYLANHSEYAVSRGMLPYVRLVGHEMNPGKKD